MTPQKNVAIVGGGPVGALLAIHLAQRGWDVDVYEYRADIRTPENNAIAGGRSINLALSARGLEGLRGTGIQQLVAEILENAVPMRGRMIHTVNGRTASQLYGVHGEFINSVDRASLNIALLKHADSFSNVRLHFNLRLTRCDLDRGLLEFERMGDRGKGDVVHAKADFIVGCDGLHSRVRSYLMRKVDMNYQQEYIPHAYCELTIPPQELPDGTTEFAMDPNHLHIWPRLTFMLIALPNADKSFTCTLFMPKEQFAQIRTQGDLDAFFDTHFPDAVEFIGRARLHEDYFRNPKGSLASIKCTPYHYKDRGLILGDAAHAMVPFFGQGLNCGFQDVTTLCRLLDDHDTLAVALEAYTRSRVEDAFAVCDLAMDNYVDMRAGTVNPFVLGRKRIEGWLYRFGIAGVIPLYSMVSFTTISYATARRKSRRQGLWMIAGLSLVCISALAGIGWKVWSWREARRMIAASAATQHASPRRLAVAIDIPVGTGKEVAEGAVSFVTGIVSATTKAVLDATSTEPAKKAVNTIRGWFGW